MNKGGSSSSDSPEKIYGSEKPLCCRFHRPVQSARRQGGETGSQRMKIEIDGVGIAETLPAEGGGGRWGHWRCARKNQDQRQPAGRCSDEVHFRGTVHDCLYLGDVTIYIVELENGLLVEAMLPNSASGQAKFFDDNDSVEIAWRFDAGHFPGGVSGR